MKVTPINSRRVEEIEKVGETVLLKVLHSSAHIITIKDIYEWEGQHFTILDYMDGKELTHVIREFHDQYSEKFIKYSIYMAARGLADMHEQDILHRDIKSDNILCSRNGDIKLADMDISVFLTEEKPYRKTFCGTDDWLSPEIVNKIPYSKEVDVWAFGGFIHELGSGEPPF